MELLTGGGIAVGHGSDMILPYMFLVHFSSMSLGACKPAQTHTQPQIGRTPQPTKAEGNAGDMEQTV